MQPGSLSCVILCLTSLPRVANHWPNVHFWLTASPLCSLSSAAFAMVPLHSIFSAQNVHARNLLWSTGPLNLLKIFLRVNSFFTTRFLLNLLCLLIFLCHNSYGIVLFDASHCYPFNRKISIPDSVLFVIESAFTVKPDPDLAPDLLKFQTGYRYHTDFDPVCSNRCRAWG